MSWNFEIFCCVLFSGIGKNVVCEKAATSVDAFRMVTASRYYPQLMSLVGNVLRFLPAFVRMKQLIAEHYVGAVMIDLLPNVCGLWFSLNTLG